MKKLILILLFAAVTALFTLSLFGCATSRHLATSSTDSVRVEIRTRTEYIRDTVIREIPAISEAVTTRDTASHLENFYAQSDARINLDGSLYHSLATKPQKEAIPIDRPIEYRDSIVYRDKTVREVVEVERELSWWQQTQIRGFWVMLVAVAAVLLFAACQLIRRV